MDHVVNWYIVIQYYGRYMMPDDVNVVWMIYGSHHYGQRPTNSNHMARSAYTCWDDSAFDMYHRIPDTCTRVPAFSVLNISYCPYTDIADVGDTYVCETHHANELLQQYTIRLRIRYLPPYKSHVFTTAHAVCTVPQLHGPTPVQSQSSNTMSKYYVTSLFGIWFSRGRR